MKTGISTKCFISRYETEDGIALLKECGAETCEIFLRTFYEYRPEFAKKNAEKLSGEKVNLISAAPYNFEAQLFSPSRRVRGDGFYWLDQILRSAQFFGAENYAFGGLGVREDICGNIDYAAERLREIISFCARYGVRFCLENSTNGLYARPFVFTELKRRCPELYGVLNIESARKSGYPYQMYIKDMADCILSVKITDFNIGGTSADSGNGALSLEEVLANLKDSGFDGTVLIETQVFEDNESISKSLKVLNETVQKLI